MPYKAKQLHLLIMRVLRRMVIATLTARRRSCTSPYWSPPPGARDFQMVPSGNTCGTMRNLCLGAGGGRKFSCYVQASLWMLSFCFLCFIQPH